MPILRFELTNRRFFHETGKDYSRRKMLFDASSAPNEELSVKDKGILKKGNVEITTIPIEGEIGSIYYVGAWRDAETDSDYPHSFSISTSLPAESFEPALNVDLDAYQIYLSLSTNFSDNSLTYGHAFDGSEKIWDVEKSNLMIAEEIVVAIVPREKPELELNEDSSPSEEVLAEAPQVILMDPQFLRQLRSIWWAIVIIGGLALVRIYR